MLIMQKKRDRKHVSEREKVINIQGPHGKSVLKENLSHTLKNKVFFLIFLVFHYNNIEKRIKTKK